MRTLFPSLRVLSILGFTAILALGQAPKGAEKTPAKDKSQLDISADSAEMDFNKRQGTFVGNVKVSDERMLLLADKMVVHLAEQNKLKLIEAMGNVVISQVGTLRKAKAGKAVFDVETDQIVLTDHPVLQDGSDWQIQNAERVVYDRKKGVFRLERVKIVTETKGKGGGPSDLFGTPDRKKTEAKKEDKK